ncbi:MAG: SDR family NAD(P)-dependent oxidoreductase [Verrucomicrobiota bacterium]
MKVFITGVSSGIGLGLVEYNLKQGAEVYGVSRRPCPIDEATFCALDITDSKAVQKNLELLLKDVESLDLVVLNAGILGEIKDLKDTSLHDLREMMEVNLWANKTLLDALFHIVSEIKQVVAISSGAAVNGNRGWGGYALSKAALNMLIQLYAREQEQTHFIALAPGLVDTAMQDYLCGGKVDLSQFSSLQKLMNARGTDAMPNPQEAAAKLMKVMPSLILKPSGEFVDIRKLK